MRRVVFVLLGLAWLGTAAAAVEPPQQVVQRLVSVIRSFAPNGAAPNAEAARAANALLDLPGVSQWALGPYWQERTPAEQQEFVALLEQLFAKVAYPKSAEFFRDLEVEIAGERVRGERAVVSTRVRHPKEGLITIDYKLHQRNGSWQVYDILLDDVSLATNLRTQCLKIIREHSYAELVRRMRDKLAE
ncbi:MAG: hypothetical protein KatS3mg131_2012 [Candidatus Tectimicrobiota bacterium]|nr:MAG: hypothetical protein KatS3mg131_2012 [Candidatus Tectomicrobia bacterium]